MCKASIDRPDAPKGGIGDDLDIGTNGYGMGTAHRRPSAGPSGSGSGTTATAESCLVCLHTGAVLELTEVPTAIRAVLDLNPDEPITLTFVETPGSEWMVIHDLVVVGGRADLGQIPFAAFAGCRATVTQAPGPDEMTPEQAIGQAALIVQMTDETPIELLRRVAAEAEAIPGDETDDGGTATVPSGSRGRLPA